MSSIALLDGQQRARSVNSEMETLESIFLVLVEVALFVVHIVNI
jgi:hypothetical protein